MCSFEAVTELHPETANRLNTKAIIFENPTFDDAISKLQRTQFYDLSVNELQTAESFQDQKEALIQ